MHYTNRGNQFDMAAFAQQNGDTRAAGNMQINARGDLLDDKGNIMVPAAAQDEQTRRAQPRTRATSLQSGLNPPEEMTFVTPAEIMKEVEEAQTLKKTTKKTAKKSDKDGD